MDLLFTRSGSSEDMCFESGASITGFGANTTNLSSSIVNEQYSATRSDCPIQHTEKEFTSAKSCPSNIDAEDDLLFIDECKIGSF